MGKEDWPDKWERFLPGKETEKPEEGREEHLSRRSMKDEDKGVLVEVIREWLRK